ncbi:cation diffusion facilitator family transporter [Rubrobacter tropicus]|uniref:Cation diffusion facilitator family transporter n=1 Tax=Rubrobacter tropicus TaxID=2653851 RepID=A0A6G8QDF9_9ACTN|nr:cation diffusion facilitator family transporter [Rubrobacter tropicus]QIN84431.1 cation diffusion facilitator family transporter [Rubrobacter tropicus]
MSGRHGHGDDHHDADGHHGGGWAGVRRSFSHVLSHLNPFGHSHDAADSVDDALASNEEGIRALKISLVALVVTALLQAVVVAFSGSVALLADTIHNFGDALTALPLWVAFALAKRPANRAYTYGYGRAEDLAGVAIVGLILFSACVAGYQSVTKLINGSEVSNVGWVAAAGVVGFLGNELVAQFRIRVGKKIGSAALVADGQHARTDGFTSLAVVAGALGVAFGYPILDPLVGLGITVAILFIVKDSASSMWRRMMDAVEPEVVDSIEEVAAGVPGVEGVGVVRARWVGHRIHSEVEIGVLGGVSASEIARIRERLSAEARRAVPKLERLVVEAVPCG